MKLLMITRTLAEFANAQGKLREIAKLGVDLTVVSPALWAGRTREIDRVRPDGYEFIVHRCRFSATSSVRIGNHLHFYPNIDLIVGREPWDLVHLDEEPFNFATYHALRACRKYGARTIFTTWQNMVKKYPPPFSFFESFTHRYSSGAIAGNREALQVLEGRGFRKPTVQIPQLGVDPWMFRKEDAGQLRARLGVGGRFVIGFVGRLSPEKGVDTLIESLALLPHECILVVVGSGSERETLKAIAVHKGVSDRIRWVPWVDSSEVPEYMNAFDVLVLPSKTRNVKEQFGRVLVEGMCCETCVIGSDVGDIPNVVGDAGYLFREGNARDLSSKIRHCWEDNALREKLGRQGRKRVLERFSYRRIAELTVDFYRQMSANVEEAEPVLIQQ